MDGIFAGIGVIGVLFAYTIIYITIVVKLYDL